MHRRLLLSIVLVFACHSFLLAEKPAETVSDVSPECLVDAKCVVDITKKADRKHSLVYKKAKLYFSSEAAMKQFAASPKKYEHFANYQLVLTKQYKQVMCPLSGEPRDEFSAEVSVGKVKFFVLCPDCAKDLLKGNLSEQIKTVFDAEGFKLGKFALQTTSLKSKTVAKNPAG